MSVKAMGLVWDLPCPQDYNGIPFKPSHKYTLIAYADHADHEGKNIWPAVSTISRKTGLDERTIQRLTRDLEMIGLLVEDGTGPRGTNRWSLPFSRGGDKLSPRQIVTGDKSPESLGDIPSGDIPSGDKLTPELKEPEQGIYISTDKEKGIQFLQTAGMTFLEPRVWRKIEARLQADDVVMKFENQTLKVMGLDGKEGQFTEADIFESRYSLYFKRAGVDVQWLAGVEA